MLSYWQIQILSGRGGNELKKRQRPGSDAAEAFESGGLTGGTGRSARLGVAVTDR
jgi:hypothetical protein